MKKNLPNFLIVGAAKCGTSSLHNYLNQHPNIFMSSINEEGKNVKEPQFLVKNQVKNRLHFGVWTWEEYQSLFKQAKQQKAIGESSVFYLFYYQDAIREIKNRLGNDVKIIIMLRNPIDRAYSAFQHVSRGLKEKHTFEYSLEIEEGRLEKDKTLTPMVMYKAMGMYYEMVKAYSDSFKDVHIILHEDFSFSTSKVVKEVFQFLGVDKNEKINSDIHYNVGGKSWSNNTLKKVFVTESKLKSVVRKIAPEKARKTIREILSRPFIKQVSMKKEAREDLIRYFRKDIKKLAILINKDLTNWTK
jgi:hypothetical protein